MYQYFKIIFTTRVATTSAYLFLHKPSASILLVEAEINTLYHLDFLLI